MKKTALVTGGSGGIGSEICRVLAEDGWQVAVCYKNGRAAAEALVSELKERGLCAEVFYCDIGDKDSIDKCVAEVRDSLGFVTLLVNNAGTADIELFTDMTDEKLCEMMNVNLLGAMRMPPVFLSSASISQLGWPHIPPYRRSFGDRLRLSQDYNRDVVHIEPNNTDQLQCNGLQPAQA